MTNCGRCQSTLPVVFFAWQNIDKRIPPPFGTMRKFVFNMCAGAIAGTETAAERPIAEQTVAFYDRVLSMRSATA